MSCAPSTPPAIALDALVRPAPQTTTTTLDELVRSISVQVAAAYGLPAIYFAPPRR